MPIKKSDFNPYFLIKILKTKMLYLADYFSEIEINGGSRIRSPIEEQKLLSNHLVWNKNSKSAESLDKKLASSSSNYFSNSRNTSRNASRNASRLDSESVIARAISPGIHLMNKIEPTRSNYLIK